MKKLAFIIITSLLSISCTKDKCYVCSFGAVNGVQKQPVQVCGDKPIQFVDSLNNVLPFNCTKK